MNETKERLKTAFNYLKFKGLVKSQKKLAKDIGTSEPCVSYAMNGNEKYLTKNFLIKLNNAYNNIFNMSWLLTGKGEMLASSQPSTTIASNNTYGDNASGNNNITISQGRNDKASNDANITLRPIVTKHLASMPNTDVYEVLQRTGLKLEKLVAFPQYANFDFYYQVRQDAMQPIYEKGDVLALVHVPNGANIIQGAAMVIDTKSFGFLFRRIYDRGEVYECKCVNEHSVFENQSISKDDVIRLYRVVYSIKAGD